MPGCPICNSPNGRIEIDEHGSTKQCACSFRADIRKRLPPDISEATPILASPLLQIKGPGEVVVDLTDEDLFIKSYWYNLAPHLLLVLTSKMLGNLMFPFRIVTDSDLRDVYVGARAYTSRSRANREDIPTFNGLADYVGADKELVIIRLGALGHRNRAMPGIFRETLLLRRSLCKPTWIVEEPDSIFGPGHFAYNSEVAEFIRQNYQVVDLTDPNDTRPVVPRGVAGAPLEEDEGMSLDPTPAPVRNVMPEPAIPTPIEARIDMSILEGSSQRRPRRGNRR